MLYGYYTNKEIKIMKTILLVAGIALTVESIYSIYYNVKTKNEYKKYYKELEAKEKAYYEVYYRQAKK